MNNARTLFEKIWSDHVVVVSPQGEELLYVDFNLINEGQSFLAFDQLRIEGRQSRRPEQHLAVTDHYLPTINRALGTAGMPKAAAFVVGIFKMAPISSVDFLEPIPIRLGAIVVPTPPRPWQRDRCRSPARTA